jgi:NNP family nitrate/nitrite transporter-like MFS transporter
MPQPPVDHFLPFKKALPLLVFIAFVFLLIFLCRVMFSPLLPSIQLEMGFSHSQAGRLFLFLAIGGGMGLLSNGFVSRVLVHRQTIALSVLLSGAALLITSQSQGYLWLAAGMAVTGWASGLYLPSGLATITSIASAKDWGKALAVHDIAPNLSFFLAPLLAEGVLYFASWREALLALGTIQILAAAAFNAFGRGGSFHGQAPKPQVLIYIVKQPAFWILAALFGLAIGMGLGLYSMLPLYLISEHEFQRETANQLLAVSRIAGLFTSLVSGYSTDRLGVKQTLGLYFVLAGLSSALLGLSQGTLLVVAVFIQAMVATFFFPAGLTALSKGFTEDIRSVAVSIIIPVATLAGQGLVPAMLGYFGQIGAFHMGFILMSGLLFTGLIPLSFLKFSQETDLTLSGAGLAANPTSSSNPNDSVTGN